MKNKQSKSYLLSSLTIFLTTLLLQCGLLSEDYSQADPPQADPPQADPSLIYKLSVKVTGKLTGKLIVKNIEKGKKLKFRKPGKKSFKEKLKGREKYHIKIDKQPEKESCTVEKGKKRTPPTSKRKANPDITVIVNCTGSPRVDEFFTYDRYPEKLNKKGRRKRGIDPTNKAEMKFIFNKSLNHNLKPKITMSLAKYDYETEKFIFDKKHKIEADSLDDPLGKSTYRYTTTKSENDTLTIKLSWIRFPENARLAFQLSKLKSARGISVEDHLARGVFNKTPEVEYAYYKDKISSSRRMDTFFIPKPADSSYPSSEQTTTDTETKAIWRTCALGQTRISPNPEKRYIRKCNSTVTDYTWLEAVNACSKLNKKKLAGKDNWRLATSQEIKSLYMYNPYLSGQYFPGMTYRMLTATIKYESDNSKVRTLNFKHSITNKKLIYGERTYLLSDRSAVRCISNPKSAYGTSL